MVDELTSIKLALQKSEDEARWLRKKNQELEQEVQDKLKASKVGDTRLVLEQCLSQLEPLLPDR